MELMANWSYPNHVRFGVGRIKELAEACVQVGIERPLLVTDRGLAEADITRTALDILSKAGLGQQKASGSSASLFADVDPNPTERNLEAGVAAFHTGGHDGVIAFGGGSGLDLGKLIAFMAGQRRPVWDFEDIDDWWTRADAEAIFPIVAVPTTAGTGSEVGRAGVLTRSDTRQKKIIFHPGVLPSVVICDPALTIGLPPALTAGTGLDAFAHCVEAFSSPHFHPMSQGVALEGMRLVIENLPRAYGQPDDVHARGQMMAAGMMGAVAFQKGLGAIHALSHPIGAIHNTHHGTTNAVCMPAVLRLNAPAIEARFDRAASYLGIEGGLSGFQDFVSDFNARLGIPSRLRKVGGREPDTDLLVREALADPSCAGNPVPLTAENLRALLQALL